MTLLSGKSAIVTGGGRGIGRATARLLADHGANVVVADVDGDLARETAAGLTVPGLFCSGDLTAPGEPDRLVQAAVDAFGRLDVIVNNAGYTLVDPLHRMRDDWFQRMLDIHVIAPFRLIRAAAPYLREPAKAEREAGEEVFRKIVNVSSVSGTTGAALQGGYAAGKAAVVGMTKTLAKEWGPYKVNCNAVAFGWIETRLTAPLEDENTVRVGDETVSLGLTREMRSGAAAVTPLGRAGTPEEAAGPVFLLCTPWSDFIHGQVVTVNGGQMTGMTD